MSGIANSTIPGLTVLSVPIEPPEIIYRSSAVLVVNKPGGLLTQAPPGIDSMEVRVRQFLETGLEPPYVGCLHRLDRPVSGLLAFGLTKRATKKIAIQFETREVRKKYWAIVSGIPENSQGTWLDMMRKVPDEPRSEVVSAGDPDAKQAILNYKVLARNDGWSWLEIELETGRTHQIRLQCASNLVPLLGDEMYGSTIPFGPQMPDVRLRCISLHARQLGFFDPGSQSRVELQAPLPASWHDMKHRFADLIFEQDSPPG